MIRLDGCLKCYSGSYKFMRGCEACAIQSVMQFKGDEEDLVELYASAPSKTSKTIWTAKASSPRSHHRVDNHALTPPRQTRARFRLPGPDGEVIRLGNFRGASERAVWPSIPLISAPFARCNCRACRNKSQRFADLETEVLGISTDSPHSHRAFAAELGLEFPLLSDFFGKIGVRCLWRVAPGRLLRARHPLSSTKPASCATPWCTRSGRRPMSSELITRSGIAERMIYA